MIRRFLAALTLAIGVGVLAVPVTAQTPAGTAFSYQGQLKDAGQPYNGNADLAFRLFDAAADGVQIGTAVIKNSHPITNGLFTVDLDFGPGVFAGDGRWLEIEVNGVPLLPRQAIRPAPYALFALNGPAGGSSPWQEDAGGIHYDSGYVGIGTTTPDYALDVKGTANSLVGSFVNNTSSGGAYAIYVVGNAAGTTTGSALAGRFIGAAGSISGSAVGTEHYAYANGSSTAYGVWSDATGGETTGSEYAFYGIGDGYFSGDVGVGTDNPTAKLHIGGTPGVDGIRFPDGTLQLTAATGGTGGSVWLPNENHIYYSAGYVGIGTANPLAKLHLGGTPGVDGIRFPDGTLQISAAAGGGGSLWYANGSDIHYTAGNVGIGTHVANEKLHVGGTVLMAGFQLLTGATAGHVLTADAEGVGTWQAPSSGGGELALPYFGLADTTAAAFHVTNNGTGMGLSARTAGSYAVTGVAAEEGGTGGIGGDFSSLQPEGLGVQAWSKYGRALRAVTSSSATDAETEAIFAWNAGGGDAIEARSTHRHALFAMTDSMGSDHAGVKAVNYGPGPAILAVAGSAGTPNEYAGIFEGRVSANMLEITGDALNQGGVLTVHDTSGMDTVTIQGGTTTSSGRVITPVLEITGGSDLSEQFDITSDQGEVKPGMVVSIDRNVPGKLVVSSQAYDRTVAGILSGAGGVRTGMMMSQSGSVADGDHPVALNGRVWTWCDASSGAIRPGDLLTTSATLGHAMKVTDHDNANGAILGKAMTSLDKETGLVLVLVSLQ